MKILVGCEYSGRVREAFRARGHSAWSCDIVPSEDDSPFHIQADVLSVLDDGWDLAIFHPPCTHLACSGARWFSEKMNEQEVSLAFVLSILEAPISKIAVENPVSIISSKIRKPDQVIQPFLFGHGYTKTTCLWLKNLPLLQPTAIVPGRKDFSSNISHTKRRAQTRSKTFSGIARAMAEQWG